MPRRIVAVPCFGAKLAAAFGEAGSGVARVMLKLLHKLLHTTGGLPRAGTSPQCPDKGPSALKIKTKVIAMERIT